MVDILLAITLIVFFTVTYYIMNKEISFIWGIRNSKDCENERKHI